MMDGLQYRVLKLISRGRVAPATDPTWATAERLSALFGTQFPAFVKGKTVIDFGCGEGRDCVELARAGASRVIGLDVQPSVLRRARERAKRAGVERVCIFDTVSSQTADVIISVDSFEHFADPALVLSNMYELLEPGGHVFVSFGPTWYHPCGGHLFSVFPWTHVLFSETALLRWRADLLDDGATTFAEVSGGLNRMTIGRFEQLVAASRLSCEYLELVPIRWLRGIHTRVTREFTTSIVRCRLVKSRSPAYGHSATDRGKITAQRRRAF